MTGWQVPMAELLADDQRWPARFGFPVDYVSLESNCLMCSETPCRCFRDDERGILCD